MLSVVLKAVAGGVSLLFVVWAYKRVTDEMERTPRGR